jgi:hypothetical protein
MSCHVETYLSFSCSSTPTFASSSRITGVESPPATGKMCDFTLHNNQSDRQHKFINLLKYGSRARCFMSRHFLNQYKRQTSSPTQSCCYVFRRRSSYPFNLIPVHTKSVCGLRLSTDDVSRSFVVLYAPRAAKLCNYCQLIVRSCHWSA